MSIIPLSDEENRVIFSKTSMGTLDSYDKNEQIRVLKRLRTMLESANPQRYIYESVTGCDELEVIRVGDDIRIYCLLVMGVPQDNKTYNILSVFDFDKHNYRGDVLQRLDDHAVARLESIQDFSSVNDVDVWLEEMNAKDDEFLDQQLDRR